MFNNMDLDVSKIKGREMELFVKSLTKLYRYNNGVKTDEFIGYSVQCMEPKMMDIIKVKVEGEIPFTQDDILRSIEKEEPIKVLPENLTVRFYAHDGKIQESFKADSLKVINKKVGGKE